MVQLKSLERKEGALTTSLFGIEDSAARSLVCAGEKDDHSRHTYFGIMLCKWKSVFMNILGACSGALGTSWGPFGILGFPWDLL